MLERSAELGIIYSHRAAGMSDDAIVAATVQEIARFAPAARNARLLHADLHRTSMAIACPNPGTEMKRPATASALPRLFLAGDWTRTRRARRMGLPA